MIIFDAALDITEKDSRFILKCLPTQWDTVVMQYNPDQNKELQIKINATSPVETKNWLHSFQKLTNTCYSIYTTYELKGKRLFYKKRYHCHHNTRHKQTYVTGKSLKNTKCPSSLIISIRKTHAKYQGKYRPADPNKPCEIKIKLEHNHPINTPEILRFLKVLPEVKNQLLQLFLKGYTARNALKELKNSIKQNNPDYKQIFDDRSRCPDYNYCYYLYLKFQNEQTSDELILTSLFETYNLKSNDFSAEMAVCEDGIVVCLCPPISKRLHAFEDSGKVVCVESFASEDKNGCRIFLFLTASEIGCLPLGVIVLSNENETMVTIGLSLLKEMLADFAFGGNSAGPDIFVTDELLSRVLPGVWPKSKIYLSTFHVLKNIWQWLSNPENQIASEDRSMLFRDFYNTLFATCELNFNISFGIAQRAATKYQNFLNYLNRYYEKKDLWAKYRQPQILKTENEATKFSESTVRFLRSSMFKFYKSFELVPIVRFVLNKYFPYFEKRCSDISTNSVPEPFCFYIQLPPEDIITKIQIIAHNMRLIPSYTTPNTYYLINTDLLTCTCPNSNSNAICKHVQCVAMVMYQQTFKDTCRQFEVIRKCHFLATGEQLGEAIVEFNEIPIETEVTLTDELDPLQISVEYTPNIEDLEEIKDYQDENIEDLEEIKDFKDENIDLEEIKEFQDELCVDNFAKLEAECLAIAGKESLKKECLEIWQNMKIVFDALFDVSSVEIAPIMNKIAAKFESFNSVAELKAAFNIFDPVEPKKVQKRPTDEVDNHDDEMLRKICKN